MIPITYGKIRNLNRNEIIAAKLHLCKSFFSRLKGMLGEPKPGDSEAYWLIPCKSIHTLAMRYTIDVYFLSKELKIVKMLKKVKPNRFLPICFEAHSVLEFANGERNCEMGDNLSIIEMDSHESESIVKNEGPVYR